MLLPLKLQWCPYWYCFHFFCRTQLTFVSSLHYAHVMLNIRSNIVFLLTLFAWYSDSKQDWLLKIPTHIIWHIICLCTLLIVLWTVYRGTITGNLYSVFCTLKFFSGKHYIAKYCVGMLAMAWLFTLPFSWRRLQAPLPFSPFPCLIIMCAFLCLSKL